jgi:hypothetical protein
MLRARNYLFQARDAPVLGPELALALLSFREWRIVPGSLPSLKGHRTMTSIDRLLARIETVVANLEMGGSADAALSLEEFAEIEAAERGLNDTRYTLTPEQEIEAATMVALMERRLASMTVRSIRATIQSAQIRGDVVELAMIAVCVQDPELRAMAERLDNETTRAAQAETREKLARIRQAYTRLQLLRAAPARIHGDHAGV